ncbi:Glu/Leu/Phe/Val dehydrogenase [Thermoproteota archaeon]
MPESVVKSSDIRQERMLKRMKALSKQVRKILEEDYKMDINTSEKTVDTFFSPKYLPNWYFHSNSAEEIAEQIFINIQLLNANNEFLEHASKDSKSLTYFINIGRDYPGRLARIIKENIDMGIVSFDSVKTKSGVRIVTIEKRGKLELALSEEEKEELKELKKEICAFAEKKKCGHINSFLKALPNNYLKEELNSFSRPRRINRHAEIYDYVLTNKKPFIKIEDTSEEIVSENERLVKNEQRISLGMLNPDKTFILDILSIFQKLNINLNRTYFDLFSVEKSLNKVCIISLYLNKNLSLSEAKSGLRFVCLNAVPYKETSSDALEKELESIIRSLIRKQTSSTESDELLNDLNVLVKKNITISDPQEMNDFYLNSVTDFMQAARFIGIDKNHKILRLLLGYEAFDEFFVSCQVGENRTNEPGFRAKHNNSRGKAFKGGLRIDPIVKFVEVAALSFMMTWKCARSKILFGGSKGGLMISPKIFEKKIDFFDSLANFGRSLFLVTGPSLDVPAGDVGCGGEEIGNMFEGFKSALRDLALMAYGIKKGVALIGDRVISMDEARHILAENFDIDFSDSNVIKELAQKEKYLELVNAAQITGKPRMGIQARTGATGRGLCYSILQTVSNLYFDKKWMPDKPLTESETLLLKNTIHINEAELVKKNGKNLISDAEWEKLRKIIYPKLLKNKTVVVQGSGKVGASILSELDVFGINVIAVSDAGGAIIGNHLSVPDLLKEVDASKNNPDRTKRSTVIGAKKNVTKTILGAKEGSVILELECDILIPAALENAVTAKNAGKINAKIEACGSNGTNTSKAEILLEKQGVTVIYDFLANGGGVTASYFEWLRNLTERFRYEAEVIHNKAFDIQVMTPYIMPEFGDRIKEILVKKESKSVTDEWNLVLRDIMFAAVNDDYSFAKTHKISMKTAGFVNTILRVLTAALLKMSDDARTEHLKMLTPDAKQLIKPYFRHPEARMHHVDAEKIGKAL